MSAIDVVCKVREYPDGGGEYQTLIVHNHWNYSDRVILEISNKQYIFLADDLIKAIANARNAHRF